MRVVQPPIKNELRVRRYSVAEHFRFMGFRDEKINLTEQSYQQLCKMMANGWDVNLASLLFEQIFINYNNYQD